MRAILGRVVRAPLGRSAGVLRVDTGAAMGMYNRGGYAYTPGVSEQKRGFGVVKARWDGKTGKKMNNTGEEVERLRVRRAQSASAGAGVEGESGDGDGDGMGKGKGKKLEDAMTKGKLLTTPSRLFKLLIPLSTNYHHKNKDIEPIAILVHPQQPLSHLERLIQSELPPLKTADNQSRPPTVSFIALQLSDDPIRPKRTVYKDQQLPTEGDTYTYLRDTPSAPNTKKSKDNHRLVRWSQSTEIGDFIRDAARAREFIVSVEQAPAPVSASDNSHSNDNNNNDTPLHQIRIAVPSFDERTYFLRMRLRKISGRIKSIAEIKHECDALAHRGAQRVAIGGFGVLSLWWYLVYKLTFETDLGWDTMEPVTYLVSLSTLMGGYLWFLYHNREISYRSALDFTINARQKKLYQAKGVDLHLWETLIDEGNTLRREIKTIAAEYDVEWDEMLDERDESVTQALKEERTQKNGSKRARDDDDERARDDD